MLNSHNHESKIVTSHHVLMSKFPVSKQITLTCKLLSNSSFMKASNSLNFKLIDCMFVLKTLKQDCLGVSSINLSES